VLLATVGGNEDNARSAANTADIITALDARLTTRVTVTALHDAVVRGPDVLRLLLDHGAKLDMKDKRGRTPLDVA
jgi:ankyrin repeat protein